MSEWWKMIHSSFDLWRIYFFPPTREIWDCCRVCLGPVNPFQGIRRSLKEREMKRGKMEGGKNRALETQLVGWELLLHACPSLSLVTYM